jgi:hypothetical protein
VGPSPGVGFGVGVSPARPGSAGVSPGLRTTRMHLALTLSTGIDSVRKAKSHLGPIFLMSASDQLRIAYTARCNLRLLKTRQLFFLRAERRNLGTRNSTHRRAVPAGFREISSVPGGFQYDCSGKQGEMLVICNLQRPFAAGVPAEIFLALRTV